MDALTTSQAAIISALIGAITSTIISPLIQIYINKRQRTKDHEKSIALPLEYVHTFCAQLASVQLNPTIPHLQERIDGIENFHDAVFNTAKHQFIKAEFLAHIKSLAERHQIARPWGDWEYKEVILITNYLKPRIISVLKKKPLPPEPDPRR